MELDTKRYYKFLAPRPVVLITTMDEKGNINAAPFSFVMPVSMDPPLLAFASGHKRDTLENIRKTKEFVVNIPTEEILDKLWGCSKDHPSVINELDEVGLSEEFSKEVKPPKVKECIAWFECKLESDEDLGDHALIIGKIVNVEADNEFIDKKGGLDIEKSGVLMHVGGSEFAVPGRIIHPKVEKPEQG